MENLKSNESKTENTATTYEIFTMADDKMAKHLAALLFSIQENSGVNLSRVSVIPFDDNVSIVSKVCDAFNAKLITPDEKWDDLGKTLYKNEKYRPNVLCWPFFRKFNALSQASGRYAFIDANSIITSGITPIFDALDNYDVIFTRRSQKGRNFSELLQTLLNMVNPYIKDGFASSFWATSFDERLNDTILRFKDAKLRPYLGPAPEQSILSTALALNGKRITTVGQATDDLYFGTPSPPIKLPDGTLVVNIKGEYKKVAIIKWSGKNMRFNDTMINKDIFFYYLNGAINFLTDRDPSFFYGITPNWFLDDIGK